jgi:hypothetical protein
MPFNCPPLDTREAGDAEDAAHGAPQPLSVVFLLDASGSLSEVDFVAMKNGVKALITTIRQRQPNAQVGVLQFTTEAYVAMPLSSVHDLAARIEVIDGMLRMSGGTSFEVPLLQVRHTERGREGERNWWAHTGGGKALAFKPPRCDQVMPDQVEYYSS